ncbi:MAG TPA: peptidoglycan-binding domain-containing protein [Thermoleophilaceae bacterium]|nr:peptidoglycan-binding domain-containing protein [Thermoleophilaceae bacterium]
MRGPDVRALQRQLTRAGIDTAVDGIFGARTTRSMRRFERGARRRVDGVVSRSDARALRGAGSASGGALAGPPPTRGSASLTRAGLALPPASAPPAVAAVIAAANEIAHKPYRYGGGHGRWKDRGYDCSGSISYALNAGGLLRTPLASTGFMRFGRRGKGRWITTYANRAHAYMVVAGLRFDTSARRRSGSRWTAARRSGRSYVKRHPAGL